MPRFVILEHHHLDVHWDFMLESDARLRTWRLENRPTAGSSITATAIPDHRLIYLDYEGEISGGRGHVVRWDSGEFEWIVDEPETIDIVIRGARVAGRIYLLKGESDSWNFRLTPAEPDSDESAG